MTAPTADGYVEGGWGLLVASETLSPAKKPLRGTNVGPNHLTRE